MVNCLLTFLKGKSTLFLVETKRLLTWREEDSSTRKVLQCGSSQRHSQIQFTCKGLYLPLALRSSQVRGWKILVPARYQHHLNCLRYRQKIQYQGQTKQKQRRVGQCLITAIKAKHYLWRYQESCQALTAVTILLNAERTERSQIRDTQRLFSVKYLFGEANAAQNFLLLEEG